MNFQKLVIALFILPSLVFGGLTSVVEAESDLSEQENQVQLLIKIQQLLQIILQLQKQIKSQNREITADREVYQSEVYTFPHEEIYFVDGLTLINSDKSGTVRKVDQQIFDFFTSIIGREFVLSKIDEWKIFYNPNSDIDAYVESINNMNGWVVGVNREGFDTSDTDVKESFIDLFLHEYSHILLIDFSGFNQKFSTNFWTINDRKHQIQIETANEKDKFDLANDYYNKNSQRFVSDYATMSIDEDMAETFVYFVRENKPTGNIIRDQKIRSFYQESNLVKIRTQIRENLKTINL